MSFPDYYTLLNVPRDASPEQIRQAYKRESLRTHPDRLTGTATDADKRRATEKFQAVADAYYVLSDSARRREYDMLHSQQRTNDSADPGASSNFFATFSNLFTGAGGTTQDGSAERPDPEEVFGDVFEELLRPEVENRVSWWKYVGGVSGAAIGYIVANIPGLMVGGYAGNRLGSIRDAKGKPVAVVFAQLGGGQKAEILRALALKVLGFENIARSFEGKNS